MFHDPQSRVLFVHIPKSGGISVRAALLDGLGLNPEGHRYHDPAMDRLLKDHSHPRHCHAAASELRREVPGWDELRKFAVVRNPWARAVSLWRFCVKPHGGGGRRARFIHAGLRGVTPDESERQRVRLARLGLDDWLHFARDQGWRLYPLPLNRSQRPSSEAPQSWWLDAAGIEVFKLEAPTAVREHIESLCGRPVHFDRLNTTRHEDYRNYFTPWSRRLIEEAFAEDIDRWGYAF